MKWAARFRKRYAEADWIARLIVTTCFAAALNFGDVFSEHMRLARQAGTYFVDSYQITVCFGPPPAFRPRLFVLLALLIATLGAFKKTVGGRVVSSVGLAGSLAIYISWWRASYASFLNFESYEIKFLDSSEIRQAAYLYGASWLDLGVALSTFVCLTLVLDRLFDGEKCSFDSA